MAKKKKQDLKGQINFYKAMAVLGVIIAGMFVYMLLDSAPHLSKRDFHDPRAKAAQCLNCHTGQASNIPIMPHRRMEDCTFCHTPDKAG
ncbi:hypothetical protein LQ236_002525 [Nitrospina gracilis]|uniref:hypothetical protein n=1 Tax=Nitrospina sp. Nb-3 TaxID=2940485 RepID=UPI001F3A7E2D|nr:hypothetical protein [Nitrospina sp. Nb-3]MCF8724505.1 hypothetical protein [Nitrospina sp. Nb-3]